MKILVGTWTKMGGTGTGIHLFDFDGTDFRYISSNETLKDTSILSVAGNHIYATIENKTFLPGIGGIASYEIKDNELIFLNAKSSQGANPAYVIADEDYIVVCNHGSYTPISVLKDKEAVAVFDDATIALYARDKDGSIGDLLDAYKADWCGTTDFGTNRHLGKWMFMQNAAHFHSVNIDKNRYVYTCDKGADKLLVHQIRDDRLHFITSLTTDAGSAPRHLSQNGEYLYVCNELEPTVTVCRFRNNSLQQLQKVRLCEGSGMPADIHIHPGGRYLYACVRDANVITLLHIKEDGTLEVKDNTQLEGSPRSFAISSCGKYLIASELDTHKLKACEIKEDGHLHFITSCDCNSPTCIRIP